MTTAEDSLLAKEAFARMRQHFSPLLMVLQRDIADGAVEVTAEGARVQLSDGRSLLDFGNYAVTLVGHRNPRVVDAVRAQLDRMTTSTRVLCNPVAAALADRLVEFIGVDSLKKVWFGLNGSDVVELSLKLARAATGRRRLLAIEGAYHGVTLGALSVTFGSTFRDPFERYLADVTHIAIDDEQGVEREVAKGDVAALIFEPIQGEGGVRPIPTHLLQRWVGDARVAGTMTIADEIQVGLGRCGVRSICADRELNVDAVLVGKPLGGGVMPLSAAVCSSALYRPLARQPFMHSSTFSGHPLSCAASLAALDEIDLHLGRVSQLAALMAEGLKALTVEHRGLIRSCRGEGLLWGIEFESAECAQQVAFAAVRQGLLLSPCADRSDVLRMLPPTVATDDEVLLALNMVRDACGLVRSA